MRPGGLMAYCHGRWWCLHFGPSFCLSFWRASWADPLSSSLFITSNPFARLKFSYLNVKNFSFYGCFGPTFTLFHLNICIPIGSSSLLSTCKRWVNCLRIIEYSLSVLFFLKKEDYQMHKNILERDLLSWQWRIAVWRFREIVMINARRNAERFNN